ncbi:MAG: hypothetical protein KDC53_07395 [Saprospiraceae bacterium]|nr:hypothetical protein [Saprospiraceae bacterium]
MTYLKNWSALIVVLILGMFMASCDKESTAVHKDDIAKASYENTVFRSDYSSMEEYLEHRNAEIEKSGIDFRVEPTTVEELNAIMIENGLEPFTEEEVTRAHKRGGGCGPYPCSTWVNHGDWATQDGVLSTYDLVKANKYVCDYYPYTCPADGGYIDNIVYKYINGQVSGDALDFAQLSYFWCEGGDDVLDNDDMLAARAYILGQVICN